jgi:hypothetical protein
MDPGIATITAAAIAALVGACASIAVAFITARTKTTTAPTLSKDTVEKPRQVPSFDEKPQPGISRTPANDSRRVFSKTAFWSSTLLLWLLYAVIGFFVLAAIGSEFDERAARGTIFIFIGIAYIFYLFSLFLRKRLRAAQKLG